MKHNKKEMSNKYELYIKEGLTSIQNADYKKAKECFFECTKLSKTNIEAYINLSNIFIIENNIKKSTSILLNYLDKINYNDAVALQLAKIYFNYNLNNELKKLFGIIKLDYSKPKKQFASLYHIQGRFYEKNSDFLNAKKSYKFAILCDNFYFDTYISLLNLLEFSNHLEEFKTYLSKGFKNFKNDDLKILNYFKALLFFRNKDYEKSQKFIIEKKLSDSLKSNIKYYIKINDLESKNEEKLKNYNSAFKKITLRNKLIINLRENKKYNKEKIINNFSSYKKFFIKKNINFINNNSNYEDDSKLIFLVGFPRSGTTLLDTILRTHSKIRVLEEKPYLLELRHSFFQKNQNKLDSLYEIDQYEINHIRKSYFEKINFKHSDSGIVIDKLPLTITELGFIKCVFPKSKVILALRHPCDVVVSCYFSLFKTNDAMINFLDWNDTISFYNNVFELFEHYEKELDLNYYTIKYENLVSHFEKEIKILLNFIGLEYEKELENFYSTAKSRVKISTPSYNQVINPLYSSSIGRWKNYKDINNPEQRLIKWIKKFNY